MLAEKLTLGRIWQLSSQCLTAGLHSALYPKQMPHPSPFPEGWVLHYRCLSFFPRSCSDRTGHLSFNSLFSLLPSSLGRSHENGLQS